jgi:hypothetical protein
MTMRKRVERFVCKCEECGSDIVFTKAKPRRFCSNDCKNQWQKVAMLGENNPAHGKTYRTKKTHPEWAKAIRKTTRERAINSGDKNPMKRPDVAKKMSETRRKNVTSDPEYRKNLSEKMKQRWREGRYENVSVGRCKWFTVRKKDGTVCKVQGTWEKKYAQYLDENDVAFKSHRGRLSYIDRDGNRRSYFPDFYLIDLDEFVEIKSAYHLSLGGDKLERVQSQNHDIVIRLMMRQDLRDLGIDV